MLIAYADRIRKGGVQNAWLYKPHQLVYVQTILSRLGLNTARVGGVYCTYKVWMRR
jgi:hypothetical protein